MNKYTIYCTESQTKKALELDAPITKERIGKCITEGLVRLGNNHNESDIDYLLPTVEQMIGWLEEQEEFSNICIRKTMGGNYSGACYCNGETLLHQTFSSRKEATLAAIDVALEYLNKNKKHESV